MRDYSLDRRDSKRYILSYEIKDNKIIIKLASGEEESIPYTNENEKSIITRMENQVRNIQPLDDSGALYLTYSLLYPIYTKWAFTFFTNRADLPSYLILIFMVCYSVYFPKKAIKYAIESNDITKLKYFLANKEVLNANINKDDSIKFGISKKAAEQIKLQEAENREPININNIDNYSLRDLKKLKRNIAEYTYLELEKEMLLKEQAKSEGKASVKRRKKSL